MSTLYADTSAIVRAYLEDEADHSELRALLLDGLNAVITSELARVEFARAVTAAARAGRTAEKQALLDRFDLDCRLDGPIRMLTLDAQRILAGAFDLVLAHQVGTLDALHLATALTERGNLARVTEMAFVTRDEDQAAAARAEGLEVL
ncbi:type II toxin-antitoxin system VapC family toxin [soil metagenome]